MCVWITTMGSENTNNHIQNSLGTPLFSGQRWGEEGAESHKGGGDDLNAT